MRVVPSNPSEVTQVISFVTSSQFRLTHFTVQKGFKTKHSIPIKLRDDLHYGWHFRNISTSLLLEVKVSEKSISCIITPYLLFQLKNNDESCFG